MIKFENWHALVLSFEHSGSLFMDIAITVQNMQRSLYSVQWGGEKKSMICTFLVNSVLFVSIVIEVTCPKDARSDNQFTSAEPTAHFSFSC